MRTIKKYGNRRLYDTDASSYITQEELAATVREGTDVQVLDAKTGEDLTQATLAQIILESRGASKLLPVPLLVRMIRMQDEALGEFLGRYLSASLELYLQAKQGAQALAPYNPFAGVPFTAANALARLFSSAPGWDVGAQQQPSMPAPDSDLAAMRRELDELKRSVGKGRTKAKASPKARRR